MHIIKREWANKGAGYQWVIGVRMPQTGSFQQTVTEPFSTKEEAEGRVRTMNGGKEMRHILKAGDIVRHKDKPLTYQVVKVQGQRIKVQGRFALDKSGKEMPGTFFGDVEAWARADTFTPLAGDPIGRTAGIGRSATGKLHWVEGSISGCNHSGQRRTPRYAQVDPDATAKAADETFCRKCFPQGKKQALRRLAILAKEDGECR